MATTFSSLDVPVETPEDFPVAHFSSLLEMTFRSKSVDEYKDLMYKMQAVRQHIVKALLSSKRIENPEFLNRIIDSANDKDRKPIMITDWADLLGSRDGGLCQKCTQRTVVFSAAPLNDLATFDLTAGSLKNPGILNLTALPIDGPVVFSGSWGREWWQGDHRVVHNDGISNEEIGALDQVNEEMRSLLTRDDGVQRKVDRLTLGVQTVCKHVHPDLSSRYQEEVRARMKRVDPCKQILYFDPSSKLDVDVGITKAQGFIGIPLRTLNEILGTKKSFDKNDFLLFVSSNRGPFLHQSIGFYKDSSHAIFVGLDDENKKKEQWRNPRTQLNVSCPDIIHAAISHLLSAPKPGL
ncbi:putative trehalose-6-phosphate synthase 2 [Aphelenchoides fujianensis]|nr:putative trehalose-6-phosphate synthase 2 [Aphelenchoides fujianensis]